jgi:hypothetical protein
MAHETTGYPRYGSLAGLSGLRQASQTADVHRHEQNSHLGPGSFGQAETTKEAGHAQ